jgi:Ca2+-binding EF-hand superfamily protein
MSVSRAKKCLRNLGLEVKSDEIQSFFRSAREKTIESLDEASFVRFAASRRLQTDKAYQVFELMDQDGKGVVVLEDLQRVACDLGEDMTREELEAMVEFADRSGDGLLTPQDFVRLARKVNL